MWLDWKLAVINPVCFKVDQQYHLANLPYKARIFFFLPRKWEWGSSFILKHVVQSPPGWGDARQLIFFCRSLLWNLLQESNTWGSTFESAQSSEQSLQPCAQQQLLNTVRSLKNFINEAFHKWSFFRGPVTVPDLCSCCNCMQFPQSWKRSVS